jgi:predicted transcriptional regulator
MGPSVRRLYQQGKSVNGAGINASIAVHQVTVLKAMLLGCNMHQARSFNSSALLGMGKGVERAMGKNCNCCHV